MCSKNEIRKKEKTNSKKNVCKKSNFVIFLLGGSFEFQRYKSNVRSAHDAENFTATQLVSDCNKNVLEKSLWNQTRFMCFGATGYYTGIAEVFFS